MSKLLLIDCYSLLFRAFFSSPPFSTKAGEPTGALYGFARMVTSLLDEHQPDYVVVAIDAPGGTFRHDADDSYKANRSDTPDDLKIQQKLVREMLDGLSIPRYEHSGFEADDVIGTFAKRGESHGQKVIVVTGDGDMLQLVDPNITVMLTKRGVSDLDVYDPAAVVKRYEFEAARVPDYKGLKGDASDNIPGVPGIGEKTAIALLKKYGSLDGIYQQLDEVTPPRIQNLLRDNEEQARHSRTLATIVTDLPVEREPEEFRYEPNDAEKRRVAGETARRFEFRSLAKRYETPAQIASAEPEPPQNFEAPFEVAQTRAEVEKWLGSSGAAVGVLLREDQIWLGRDAAALLFLGEIGELRAWLEDAGAPKIAHDVKALERALQPLGLHFRGARADTLLMSYLIEPTRQNHPLAHVAEKFLNLSLPEPPAPPSKAKAAKAKNVSLFGDDAATTEDADARAAQHAHDAASVAVLGRLEPVLRERLKAIGAEALFDQLELPMADVLAQMECVGMLLQPQILRDLGVKLEADATRLQSAIWQAADEEFNIGSPKQLQVILFEKLNLESGRKNKSGGYSTDVHTLERLAEENEIVRQILEYRGTTKLKSTYVDALLAQMEPATHRIHSSLNQTGTVSGRLSSSDPNLQNVPIRTEQGRLIRKAFIAPQHHTLMSVDYSQIELRILAHITGDVPLVEAFRKGEDVHATTAARLFGVDVKHVDAEMRRKAKMTNYAIAYGVSGFGLAKQLGSGTSAEAKEFIDRYFEGLPGVKKYIDDTLESAKKLGYVETLMGRRRPVPEINSNRFQEKSAAERTAINHPIQGTSADVMKVAMLAIGAEMRERNLQSSMTMQVHDELVFEVLNQEIEAMKEMVGRLMTSVPQQRFGLKVPLAVDIGLGADWDSTKGGE